GANALPDPVLAITSQGGPNMITACGHDTATPDGCTPAARKVALASSNLQSQSPAALFPECFYCYGNANKASSNANLRGLRDTIIPNQTSGTQFTINNDLVVLTLANNSTFGVTFTERFAAPVLNATSDRPPQLKNCHSSTNCSDPAPACVTAGSGALQINGIGFGPPGACTTAPFTTCPTVGNSSTAGASITYTGGVTGTVVSWSDSIIVVTTPVGATNGPVTITTPIGTVATAAISVCP